MKKIISLFLCLAMLLAAASCSLGKEDAEAESDNSAVDPSKVVMSTENFSITFAELNYIFFNQYNQFLSNYAQQLGDNYASAIKSYIGLDVNASLKDQTLPDQSDTFYNYFLNLATSQAKDILIFCEYSKENGLAITDEDKSSIEDNIKSYENGAIENNVTLSEYMGDKNGLTTTEILRSYAEKNALAYLGYKHQQASHEYSDEQVEKEFSENPEKYAMVSYLAYTIQPNDANLTADNVKTYADELAATTDEASFKAYVEDFHKNVLYADETDAPTFSEDTIRYSNINYDENTEYLKWMFSDAKAGETHTAFDEASNSYTVYMLISGPGENEYDLKNVRHILFLSTSFNSTEDCRKKAEEVYDLYKNDPTEEHFAELAKEYTEDTGSAENGGLYENVDYNQMVKDFENWTFDSSRKEGDTDIILTSYGYHIMYYVGNGEHVQKGHEAAKDGLIEADYSADYDVFVNKYPITSEDEIINQIDA